MKIPLPWGWSVTIMFSTIAVGLVTFVAPGFFLRPLVAMWFCFVCPGMAVVRCLRLNEPVAEWTLALALSLSLDAIVASVLLYAGRWSPAGALVILMGVSLGGASLRLAPRFTRVLHIERTS